MSTEVAFHKTSTCMTAPGLADGAALDSLSLFETTARVTAVSHGSARRPKHATTRVTRKRARASSSPERPHATTSASAPTHATRDPTLSHRDATARTVPSSRRNGSEDRASRTATGWCALPRLRVDAAPAPPPTRVARSADDTSRTRTDAEGTRDAPSSLDSTVLMMLTPVERADAACSF